MDLVWISMQQAIIADVAMRSGCLSRSVDETFLLWMGLWIGVMIVVCKLKAKLPFK